MRPLQAARSRVSCFHAFTKQIFYQLRRYWGVYMGGMRVDVGCEELGEYGAVERSAVERYVVEPSAIEWSSLCSSE